MELRNCVSGEAKFVALWHQICDEQDADQRKWVDSLRAAGFKAAHYNDGWVNRRDNEVHFAYPQFNDGAAIGDLVMLGWPWDKKSWRTVRLIGLRVTALGKMVWWQFEDVPNVEFSGTPAALSPEAPLERRVGGAVPPAPTFEENKMPTVFNKYHKPPSTAVYIGRGSPWGNPFVIGKDGDRDTVCDKYAAMVESDPSFKTRVIANLRGKDLVCFCAPQRCHGDYLLKVANAELRGRPLADGPA